MVMSANSAADSVWGRGWEGEEARKPSDVLAEGELTRRKSDRKVRVGCSVSSYLQVTRAVIAPDPQNSMGKGSVWQLDRVSMTGKSGEVAVRVRLGNTVLIVPFGDEGDCSCSLRSDQSE